MPTYNAYTKTNDFPLPEDYWIDPATGKKLTFFELNRSPVKDFIKRRANDLFQSAFREWVIKYNIPQSVIDEWNRLAQQAFDEATVKNFWQRMAEKVTNTVSNFISQAGNVLQGAGESVLWAKLLPFKVLMVNALRRKGEDVKLTDKMSFITKLFKQRIIDKKTSTNYLYHNEADATSTDSGEEMNAQEITSLVKTIIDFITLILQKKKDGTASEDERLMGKDGEDAGENVVNGGAPTTTGVNAPTGDNWFAKYKFVIIGAVAVVLFLAFRKKK